MISPKNLEEKLGFDVIRNQIRGLCLSTLGGDEVRSMHFMDDVESVEFALRGVEEMDRILHSADGLPMEYIDDLRVELADMQIQGRYLEESRLWALRQTLRSAQLIISCLRRSDNDELLYPHLAAAIPQQCDFRGVLQAIDAVLGENGKLRDDASPELQKTRSAIESLKRSTSILVARILKSAQASGIVDKDASPVLRDERLVIPVAADRKRSLRGIVHDESASGKTIFIEPQEIVELGNRQKRLEIEEERIVIAILRGVADSIRPSLKMMIEIQHFLGHIDALRAKSLYSASIHAAIVFPSTELLLNLIDARNPILESALQRHGKQMTPLNVSLTSSNRLLLISGPNAGGKSVCLKTVGLLQYMLQCGLPIPASEGSRTGIFTTIFLDIGDEQSLQDDLSTYSSRLIGYKAMLNTGGPTSLFLIDEFGSGTEPKVGAAIAQAVLSGFLQMRTWGILTTHYQNLKDFAAKTPGIRNAAMAYSREELRPLYKLLIGEPGSAYALETARKIGLPPEIILQAERSVGEDYIMSDQYLQSIARDKLYWAQKRDEIDRRQQRLDRLIEEQQQSLSRLSAEREEIVTKAKNEAQELIAQSRATIENTIRTIRQSQAEQTQTRAARRQVSELSEQVAAVKERDELIARKMRQIEERARRRQSRKRKEKQSGNPSVVRSEPRQTTFSVGMFVRIDGQNTVLRIESIRGTQATVSGEAVKMKIDLKRLQPAERSTPSATPRRQPQVIDRNELIHRKRLVFKPEIDVRGLSGEEAVEAVSDFVDDAILLEVSPLRILHGTGSGYLRMVIREYLRSLPDVTHFGDEDVRFGGAGITIVTLG